MEKEKNFIVKDIPLEWRVAIENVKIPERPLPEGLPEKIEEIPSYQNILKEDNSLHKIPIVLDKTEQMLEAAKHLIAKIQECKQQLLKAEEKRLIIASSAELIHGECDSQLAAEQRLDIFVKSIDSILHYFEDLEKVSLDFKAPMYSVLSSDFQTNLKLVESGIRFFEINTRFKDSRLYLLKYQSLQKGITDLIKDYISSQFVRISRMLVLAKTEEDFKNEIYIKYKADPGRIRKYLVMCEKTPVFQDLLNLYKEARLNLLQKVLSNPINEITEIRPRATTIISFCYKEHELSTHYFNYDGHPYYSKCFSELIEGIGKMFYDACCPLIKRTNEMKLLADACVVLRGDTLQDEVGRIPIASERLRNQINYLLAEAQERLLFKTELFAKELPSAPEAAASNAVDALNMLYCSLPPGSFSEAACNILKKCISSINSSASKYGDTLEAEAYRLSHLLVLREEIGHIDSRLVGTSQSIDFEPVGEFLWRLLKFDFTGVSSLARVVSSTVDGRKQIEGATSLAFKSLATAATQLLVQPLLNLRARGGTSPAQVAAAVEGASLTIKEHFGPDVAAVVTRHVGRRHTEAVLGVLREQLCAVVRDVEGSLGSVDGASKAALDGLVEQINGLSFI